jgi:hypothetical protein
MMEKTLTAVTLVVLLFLLPMICAAQQGISDQSLQTSSQDSSKNSSQESTQGSSENSFQTSTEGSTQDSSPAGSSDASSENLGSSFVALIVGGAVVSIALTVGGIILTVNVSKAKKEAVLRLQDQIYLADGKDYQDILSFFELGDKDLIKANDELVAAGRQIASDRDAAEYLAALILKLAKRSEKVQYQLSAL